MAVTATDVKGSTRWMNVTCGDTKLTEVRSLTLNKGSRDIRDGADNDKHEFIIETMDEPYQFTVESRRTDQIIEIKEKGWTTTDVAFTVYGRKKLSESGDLTNLTITFKGVHTSNMTDNGAWGDLRTGSLTCWADEIVISAADA